MAGKVPQKPSEKKKAGKTPDEKRAEKVAKDQEKKKLRKQIKRGGGK